MNRKGQSLYGHEQKYGNGCGNNRQKYKSQRLYDFPPSLVRCTAIAVAISVAVKKMGRAVAHKFLAPFLDFFVAAAHIYNAVENTALNPQVLVMNLIK